MVFTRCDNRRIEKMEKHLKDVMENNRQLKKENADYRKIIVSNTAKMWYNRSGQKQRFLW